jgi:hypothetical protein
MERRSNPRLWVLLLLRTAGQSRALRQRGFSMAAVLLVLLVAVVGASSLALRSSSGISGSLQLSARREAQEAAESGATTIISELNKPQNRRLLVSAAAPETWGSTTDLNQRNPCLSIGSTSSVPPLTSAATAGSNAWQTAGGNGQFILRSVRFANRDRSATSTFRFAAPSSGGSTRTDGATIFTENRVNLDPVLAADSENFGFIQLEVQGRVQRAGRTLATATVVKEFQVIPKCCNRSFSGPANSASGAPLNSFGNDQRTCIGSSANLGLLFGFNNGNLSVSGGAGTLQQLQVDGSGTVTGVEPLAAALCITTSPTGSNCTPATITASPRDVPVIPTFFDVDPPPTIGASPPDSGSIETARYIRVNPSATTRMQICTLSSSGATVSGCTSISGGGGSGTRDYCRRVTGSTVADFHCRMTNIRITGSSPLIFDTSRGSIALFFNEPAGGRSGRVEIGGSAGFEHRFCTTPPSGATACASLARPQDFTRLSIFGSQTYNVFDFAGNSSLNAFFIYFPNGTVSFGGNPTISGAIWTKNLDLRGSFTSSTPATTCETASSGFCFILRGSQAGGTGGASAPFFDWVARNPVTTRVY